MSKPGSMNQPPDSSLRDISSRFVEPTFHQDSSGTETSTSGPQEPGQPSTNPALIEGSSVDSFSSTLKPSTMAMDPMLLRRMQSEDGALELPALSGTDLASFALTRSHSRLSVSDLNHIGMSLMKDAVAQEKPDHRAAAAVFSVMAQVNSRAAGPKKAGPSDRVRVALEKAASAIEAERRRKRTVVDIGVEPDSEEGDGER